MVKSALRWAAEALDLASTLTRVSIMRTVARDSWIIPIHRSLHIRVDPVTRGLSTNRVKNPRVGWANNMERGDEGYRKGWNKRLGVFEYAERDLWIDPWMGSSSMEHALPSMDGGRTPRVACNRFNIYKRSICLVEFCLSHIIFVLNFSYSFSFLFFFHRSGLPHAWIFQFDQS